MTEHVRVVHPVTGREVLVPLDKLCEIDCSPFHLDLIWADIKRCCQQCVRNTQDLWNTCPVIPWALGHPSLPVFLAARNAITAILAIQQPTGDTIDPYYLSLCIGSSLICACSAWTISSWNDVDSDQRDQHQRSCSFCQHRRLIIAYSVSPTIETTRKTILR